MKLSTKRDIFLRLKEARIEDQRKELKFMQINLNTVAGRVYKINSLLINKAGAKDKVTISFINSANREQKRLQFLLKADLYWKRSPAQLIESLPKPKEIGNRLYISKMLARNASKAAFVHRCILTKKARVMYKRFKIARMQLKEMIRIGLISSYKKSTW